MPDLDPGIVPENVQPEPSTEPKSTIIVYGTKWCWDCKRARRFLDKHHIQYQWIDVDRDKTAEAYVRNTNRGNRSVPTILFTDGEVLVEPSNQTLARKLRIEDA